MKTIAKFALVERVEFASMPQYKRIVFEPRYDAGIPEDARFLKATPSGRFEILTDNAYLMNAELGTQFEVTFQAIDDKPAKA